jgi:6-hydroxytryprostatin B O-methyltransferase
MPDALQIWSEPSRPGFRQIPLNLALGNDKSYFENVLATGRSMKLFSEAMESLKGGGAQDPSFIVNGFDWGALREGPSWTSVGGDRHISIAVAKTFPSLRIIVEDLPSNAEPPKAAIPDELRNRVSFLKSQLLPAPAGDRRKGVLCTNGLS